MSIASRTCCVASLLSLLLVAGCAPTFLPEDQVRDSKTAVALATSGCGPDIRFGSGAKAQIEGGRWIVREYVGMTTYVAQVSKRDGAVSNCVDIEQ
jgi:hypothetical protein